MEAARRTGRLAARRRGRRSACGSRSSAAFSAAATASASPPASSTSSAARRWPTRRSTARSTTIFELQDQVVGAVLAASSGVARRAGRRRGAHARRRASRPTARHGRLAAARDARRARDCRARSPTSSAPIADRSALCAGLHRPGQRGARVLRNDAIRERAGAGSARSRDRARAAGRAAGRLAGRSARARSRSILVSAWDTAEALRAARRAVALEPGNWRHLFRLGHASWGDERLRAGAATLALYPDFAFAHFQIGDGPRRARTPDRGRNACCGTARRSRIGRSAAASAIPRSACTGCSASCGSRRTTSTRRSRNSSASSELARAASAVRPRVRDARARIGRGAALLRAGRTRRGGRRAFDDALALYPDHRAVASRAWPSRGRRAARRRRSGARRCWIARERRSRPRSSARRCWPPQGARPTAADAALARRSTTPRPASPAGRSRSSRFLQMTDQSKAFTAVLTLLADRRAN